MAFRQLYDINTATTYTLDVSSLIFKVSGDEFHREKRLKHHSIALLEALFSTHPTPVNYRIIEGILKGYGLCCPDETRLHRKVSELRKALTLMHPSLKDFIHNSRGVGYHLPLTLKDPQILSKTPDYGLKTQSLKDCLKILNQQVQHSIELSQKCPIVPFEEGYVLNRSPVHKDLETLIPLFDQQVAKIFKILMGHPYDFITIRLELIFSKLKTYIGLTRMSEFSITKHQWIEWHKEEARGILEDLALFFKALRRKPKKDD